MKCKKCEARNEYIRKIKLDTLSRMIRQRDDAERYNNKKAVLQLNELIEIKKLDLSANKA